MTTPLLTQRQQQRHPNQLHRQQHQLQLKMQVVRKTSLP
jgi:hypothetical protein